MKITGRNCQTCGRRYYGEMAEERPLPQMCHGCRVDGPPGYKGVWEPVEWEDPPTPLRTKQYVPEPEPVPVAVAVAKAEGHVVSTERTGKTTHIVKTREPLEAVCGTRNVRSGKEPVFYASLPAAFDPCWKCERDR